MKKIILSIILLMCICLLPSVVNAQEYCKVIESSGKVIGSEMVCGTEHFYVISSNDSEIKMLAKYNLFVGDKIDYFDKTNNKTYNDYDYWSTTGSREAASDCMDYAEEKGYDPYFVYPILDTETSTITLKGCRVYEKIEYEHVVQNEKAIGTKLVDGKSLLPLYGIVYMNPEWGYERIVEGHYYYNDYDDNGDLILSTTAFEKYINGYKEELERQNIDVKNVSFITLSNTVDLLSKTSGKNVRVELENSYDNHSESFGFYYGKMNIKNLVGDNKWIYGTTYWLGSGFFGDPNVSHSEYHNDYYISNEGLLCAIGRGECNYFYYPIGNGIRPVVTVANNSVKYLIKTVTDGNGTIEVVNNAFGGDSIQFKVSAKKGLKLSGLSITSDSGETIEFNEEDITIDSSGINSISTNKFTMPFENVTIQARWTMDNPKTSRNIAIIIIALTVLSSSIVLISKKKNKMI